jgi:hypothetical protein
MSSKGLERCEKAFLRLKEGNPNQEDFKGEPITASLVSKEAGFDAGYLKFSRPAHRALLNQIDIQKNSTNSGGPKAKVAKLEKEIKKLTSDKNKYKQQRDDSLARELILYQQLSELQANKNNHNIYPLRDK